MTEVALVCSFTLRVRLTGLVDAKFHFREDPERAECEQWMGFVQSHLGPTAGEANLSDLPPHSIHPE